MEGYVDEAAAHLIKEDAATNTIENFSRTLAMFDKNPEKYKSVALLSNGFHIARILQLAQLFGLEGKGFGAEEEVLSARQAKRHEQLFNAIIDRYINSPGHFEFTKAEKRWSRGLKEVPKYALPQTVFVTGPRLRNILTRLAETIQAYNNALLESGIDPDNIDSYSEEELKELIGKIERILPPESWAQ